MMTAIGMGFHSYIATYAAGESAWGVYERNILSWKRCGGGKLISSLRTVHWFTDLSTCNSAQKKKKGEKKKCAGWEGLSLICNEFDVLLSYFKIVLEPKFATPPSFVVQALVVVVFFIVLLLLMTRRLSLKLSSVYTNNKSEACTRCIHLCLLFWQPSSLVNIGTFTRGWFWNCSHLEYRCC